MLAVTTGIGGDCCIEEGTGLMDGPDDGRPALLIGPYPWAKGSDSAILI